MLIYCRSRKCDYHIYRHGQRFCRRLTRYIDILGVNGCKYFKEKQKTCEGCVFCIPLNGHKIKSIGERFHCSELKQDYWSTTPCSKFRRKQMPDKIEISVTVNGQLGSLADVSVDTLIGMRDKATPQLPKPIEHGDYGHTLAVGRLRFFFKTRGDAHVRGYDENGALTVRCDPNVGDTRSTYVITGNIFKDMQNG